jgi:hypothetical protein
MHSFFLFPSWSALTWVSVPTGEFSSDIGNREEKANEMGPQVLTIGRLFEDLA